MADGALAVLPTDLATTFAAIVQAEAIGCHVITCTSDVLAKLGTLGKDLEAFSLETVRMFHRDAVSAGFEL